MTIRIATDVPTPPQHTVTYRPSLRRLLHRRLVQTAGKQHPGDQRTTCEEQPGACPQPSLLLGRQRWYSLPYRRQSGQYHPLWQIEEPFPSGLDLLATSRHRSEEHTSELQSQSNL